MDDASYFNRRSGSASCCPRVNTCASTLEKLSFIKITGIPAFYSTGFPLLVLTQLVKNRICGMNHECKHHLICTVLIMTTVACSEKNMTNLYDITVQSIRRIHLTRQYRGKTLLIVNTASRCGFTGQYEGLQTLYETYQDQGLVVLAFPSNNFWQEPGRTNPLPLFVKRAFKSLPLLRKCERENQHPLYAWLTSKENHPSFGGGVSWNFNKF